MEDEGQAVTAGKGDSVASWRGQKGKSVQDFERVGVGRSIRSALGLLPGRQKRLLILATGLQMSLSFLDLLGVALIGVLAALAASGVGAGYAVPPPVQTVLVSLGLDAFTLSQLIVMFSLAAVGTLILKTLFQALITRRIYRFLANRQAEVSSELARQFLRQPLLFVQQWTTSEAIYALGSGVSAATLGILGSAITIAAEIALFVVMLFALFAVDPLTAAVAVALFAAVIFVSHLVLSRRSQRNARSMRDASIDTLTTVSEALQTYRETTVLNRRELYVSRFEGLVGQNARAAASNAFILETPKYVLEVSLYLSVLVLGTSQFLLNKNLTEAATVTAVFLAAGLRLIPALLRLQGAGITIRNSAVTAQPTFFLASTLSTTKVTSADEQPSRTTRHVARTIDFDHEGFTATIKVSDVSLRYDHEDPPALCNVSLDLVAGSSTALVGSSGAGKSTLADILIGAIEPDVGGVEIGGCTPRTAIEKWSGAIAYVPQSVALIGGTIRDNVALGLPKEVVEESRIWDALERAHIADFLKTSRQGLDTNIGERGVRLSGGQRQRLGIARALYTQPKLLVLDEATSALDAETEQAIIQMLDELEGSVTTVTVAHRLATVRRADLVVYLRNGVVAAKGSFLEVRQAVPDFDKQAELLGL